MGCVSFKMLFVNFQTGIVSKKPGRLDRVEKPHEWLRADVCDLRAVCEVYRCDRGVLQGCVGIGSGKDES